MLWAFASFAQSLADDTLCFYAQHGAQCDEGEFCVMGTFCLSDSLRNSPSHQIISGAASKFVSFATAKQVSCIAGATFNVETMAAIVELYEQGNCMQSIQQIAKVATAFKSWATRCPSLKQPKVANMWTDFVGALDYVVGGIPSATCSSYDYTIRGVNAVDYITSMSRYCTDYSAMQSMQFCGAYFSGMVTLIGSNYTIAATK